MTPSPTRSRVRRTLATALLLLAVVGTAVSLYLWKAASAAAAAVAAASQAEPPYAVESAVVGVRQHARVTTSIGTARALQSINLQNELAGTVHKVHLTTGQIVDTGFVLVELDVSVEEAELAALDAEARLAASMLARMEQALQNQGASAADVDRARAEHDMAAANVARTKALIERKRIRAPFRAQVGMVDLHPGQYLVPGETITTLQGVDDAMHVDFSVTQDAASSLTIGSDVEVTVGTRVASAKIVAIDARVESATRNTRIRALLRGTPQPAPGASVRVRVPVEQPRDVLVVPVSALRRGPGGDHVFVLEKAPDGALRAKTRRVAAGASIGDEIVVKEGLTAGERVAANGSFKLREGVLVQDAAPVQKQ